MSETVHKCMVGGRGGGSGPFTLLLDADEAHLDERIAAANDDDDDDAIMATWK